MQGTMYCGVSVRWDVPGVWRRLRLEVLRSAAVAGLGGWWLVYSVFPLAVIATAIAPGEAGTVQGVTSRSRQHAAG